LNTSFLHEKRHCVFLFGFKEMGRCLGVGMLFVLDLMKKNEVESYFRGTPHIGLFFKIAR